MQAKRGWTRPQEIAKIAQKEPRGERNGSAEKSNAERFLLCKDRRVFQARQLSILSHEQQSYGWLFTHDSHYEPFHLTPLSINRISFRLGALLSLRGSTKNLSTTSGENSHKFSALNS